MCTCRSEDTLYEHTDIYMSGGYVPPHLRNKDGAAAPRPAGAQSITSPASRAICSGCLLIFFARVPARVPHIALCILLLQAVVAWPP